MPALDGLAERMLLTFQVSEFARPHGSILGVDQEPRGNLATCRSPSGSAR
jgi:hypothetical protein